MNFRFISIVLQTKVINVAIASMFSMSKPPVSNQPQSIFSFFCSRTQPKISSACGMNHSFLCICICIFICLYSSCNHRFYAAYIYVYAEPLLRRSLHCSLSMFFSSPLYSRISYGNKCLHTSHILSPSGLPSADMHILIHAQCAHTHLLSEHQPQPLDHYSFFNATSSNRSLPALWLSSSISFSHLPILIILLLFFAVFYVNNIFSRSYSWNATIQREWNEYEYTEGLGRPTPNVQLVE